MTAAKVFAFVFSWVLVIAFNGGLLWLSTWFGLGLFEAMTLIVFSAMCGQEARRTYEDWRDKL